MYKIKINKRFLAILLSMGIVFSLSSCSSSKKEDTSNSNVPSGSEEVIDSEAEVNDDIIPVETVLPEENFDYFYTDLIDVEGMIQMNKLDQVKRKAKDIFITGIDFIFYNGVISGVTFDELTEEGKRITMNNLEALGDMVDQVIPGWRDELSDKYSIASEFVGDMYLSVLDKIRGYLGDENYEALGNIKNQIFGDVHDAYDSVKGRVKSWYEEFRSKK